MRIGIIGGTFDPPHMAHMVVAEAAYRQLGLDVVRFMPAGAPWQKTGSAVTPARHRLGMTEAAVSDIPYMEADDREVVRPGYTYTIDTLEELAEEGRAEDGRAGGDGADGPPTLILGADAASRLRSWRRADEILAGARIAVAPRPGTSKESVEEAVGGRVAVAWLDVPILDISGTELRRRAAAGYSLRFLVPPPVLEYIDRFGLYSD